MAKIAAEADSQPYEPEAFPQVLPPALFRKAWTIFHTHFRLLLTFTFALTVLPVLMSLLLPVLFGPPLLPNPTPAGHSAQPPPPIVNTTYMVMSAVVLLVSLAAAVALVPVFMHVVVGNHLGGTPGNLWLAVKRSYWRLLGTILAKLGVIMGLAFAVGLLIGIIAACLTITRVDSVTVVVITLLLFLTTLLLPLIYLGVNLTLAEYAAAAEGPGVWGFWALRRSWALSKGSRWTIFLVGWLQSLSTMLLTGPLSYSTHLSGKGHPWVVLFGVATVACGLAICLGVYFKVVWVLIYLSARKKTEPEFGLTALQFYFQKDSSSPGDYLLVDIPDSM